MALITKAFNSFKSSLFLIKQQESHPSEDSVQDEIKELLKIPFIANLPPNSFDGEFFSSQEEAQRFFKILPEEEEVTEEVADDLDQAASYIVAAGLVAAIGAMGYYMLRKKN